MSFTLTQRSRTATSLGQIQPQIVLDIEGYPDLLGSGIISEIAKYGGGALYGEEGLVYGGLTDVEEQLDLVSLNGTSNQITQQLLQDDGGASSTTNLTVALVNKDNVFGSLIRPQNNDDILSKKASVWLGVEGTSYPEDFIRIFIGNVTQVKTSGAEVRITISHPEHLKRAELFTKIQTELTAGIDDNDLTLPVVTTNGLLLPSGDGLFRTYVRIDDEIIEYTGLTSTTITGCVRAQFGSIADSHDDEASVESFYVLGDGTADSNAIDLSLKVLISGSEQPWVENQAASTFGISDSLSTLNSIFFPAKKLVLNNNVSVGDFVTVTGAAESANNITDGLISQIIEEETGTRVVLSSHTLIPESSSSAVVSFTSQYATLPSGVGMTPDQVDVEEFRRIFDLFNSSLPNYKIYLKDTIKGNELINKEIFFPAACYSLPRKGRVSIGKTKPPIAEFETPILSETNILNASSITMERSVLENFYNAVVFSYEEDAVDDKFTAGKVTVSASSFGRIKIGNKPFNVISKGIRRSSETDLILESNSQRILDRFQFGAETISGVQVPFSIGWNTEVGDTVIIQGLQLLDSTSGDRGLAPRIMEITNRAFNFKQGTITLDLTDTSFSVDGRYGVISPSSEVGIGSTATRVIIKRSYGTSELDAEQIKWLQYVGLTVFIHSEDFSVSGSAQFLGFDPSNENAMLLGPGLGFSPLENYIVNIEPYDSAESLYKTVHCYFNPQILITANSSIQSEIEVANPSVFFTGSIVKVHSPDFSSSSVEAIVTNISGDVLTLDKDLGYLPLIDDEVDLIGFVSDEGLPFRIL